MSPILPVLTVLAWCGVIATAAFGGAERHLEQSCTTYAPTAAACRRL